MPTSHPRRKPPLPRLRLSKILAQAGLTSRRGAEALIVAGRVRVNAGVPVDPGTQADPERDAITVDGVPLKGPEAHAYVIVNKPRGMLSSRSDPRSRPVVIDLAPSGAGRLFPVGRLDWDAEGLLLLTNDGELANRLLHPRYGTSRVYEVEVEGAVRAPDLARWRRGVVLEDGAAKPSSVRLLRYGDRTSSVELTFHEGRKGEVKRYCQALGHPVVRLRRIRFGPLSLGKLPPGGWRHLTAGEREALRRLRS